MTAKRLFDEAEVLQYANAAYAQGVEDAAKAVEPFSALAVEAVKGLLRQPEEVSAD